MNNLKDKKGKVKEKEVETEKLPVKKDLLDISIESTERKFSQIHAFQKLVKHSLIEGLDFGVIPGTEKPTLLKPGAEKITKLLGCFDDYEILDVIRDWEKPFFHYEVKCTLYDMTSGVRVSSGIGECNSFEAKYKYRWLPEWKLDDDQKKRKDRMRFRVIKYKSPKTGSFKLYRFDNDDVYTIVNTIMKMAKKRAHIDASLSAGRLSDLFTQDLEEIIDDRTPEPIEEKLITSAWKTKINKLMKDLTDKFEVEQVEIWEAIESTFGVADLSAMTLKQAESVADYLQKSIDQKINKGLKKKVK